MATLRNQTSGESPNVPPDSGVSPPNAQLTVRSLSILGDVGFMFSRLHNGMAAGAASQPGGKLPPGTLQSNIDFYKKNEAKLAALGENDPCDDESGEEEQPEE